MTSQPHPDLADQGDIRGGVLHLPALEVRQGDGSTLYSFAVDGKQLALFATISRIHRHHDSEIQGYQRPAVLSHISAIRRYIESDSPMIPNALVVAFDKRVEFEPLAGVPRAPYARHGTLTIPISEDAADEKPGWIVDGQQRTAAIQDARVESFPICVTAFIAESDEEQRSQFILVNSAKPLPKGLIYELLPGTIGTLPPQFQAREFPSRLLYRLNFLVDSPFYRLIQTPTNPDGIIKDNSILKMLEDSLSDGALYFFRNPQTGECDEDSMLAVLKDFWRAVSRVFPDAWDKPARKSRLMHGVGIASLGALMDTIFDRYIRVRIPREEDYVSDLSAVKDVCRWTNGFWDFGPHSKQKWNELQNTSRDIQMLTRYLLAEYKNRVWAAPLASEDASYFDLKKSPRSGS
jgi:DGQHR domain-containing protein